MSKFGYMAALDISDGTAEFPIYEIEANGESPILIVKPMTQANKAYFNAVFKQSAKSTKPGKVKINPGVLEDHREKDRELFPRYCLAGWKNVVDENGVEVPFNLNDAEDFISQLPDWIFDEIRQFCSNSANFTNTTTVTVEDVEDTAKN